MHLRRHFFLVVVSMVGILPAPRAQAVILSSEGFVYSPGPLSGQSGGVGWNGAWLTGQPTVFTIQAASLTGAIGSLGGSLFYDGSMAASNTGARIFRPLDLGTGSAAGIASLPELTSTRFAGTQLAFGKPGTVVWFGVVINGGTAGSGLAGLQYLAQIHLYNGATTSASALALGDNNKDGEAIAIGRGNSNTVWNYERTCAHDNCPGGGGSSTSYLSTVGFDNATHWLVMRFDFASAASTNVTMWLDPVPGAVTPPDPSALTVNGQQVVAIAGLHFNWIELGGQTSQFAFDEVRFGTTFADLSNNGTVSAPPTPRVQDLLRLSAGPNPFFDVSTLRFNLQIAQTVNVRIVDLTGHLVRLLHAGPLGAGEHSLSWDGRDDRGGPVGAGLYLVRLRSGAGERVARVVRLR